ncbi:DUF7504 family protein [Salinibaculum rarum]|uniref:DUF7504 family protein n=1 Tax=Salinibaculum rarum TaxID=3058903 RepID=UPI00265F39E7|nr:hypothetical protein [Salinibaculum sp. KK48]
MTAVTDQLDGATNILLEVPPMGDGREVCTSLLSSGIEEPSALFVSFTRQASACLGQWEEHGSSARNLGVITVGDGSADVDRDDVVTETVSTPSDLTGLGIQIGQFLSEWEAPVVVCFDSLTSLLQYVDFETVYEFLHAITGQVYAADARAHFHVDPEAHDESTVAGLTSLVDASVSLGEEIRVRTRDTIE